MTDLLLVALAGFFASMVDGALGMGFGPASASILLSAGISPATTSATINIAKVATGLVAGASHWRFGNIDRRLVVRLALPGAAGALIGATILANVDGSAIRPILALLLVVVGLRIMIRFSRPLPEQPATPTTASSDAGRVSHVELAGVTGGVTNGLVGAWGPVVTPYLLHRGVSPRLAVGSVNTAEVAVAFVAAGTLLTSSVTGVDLAVVAAMLGGGVVAAPLAAYLVRFVPARGLGLAVATLLLVTQTRELASGDRLPFGPWPAYALIAAAVAAAALRPHLGRATTASPVGDATPALSATATRRGRRRAI